MTEARDTDAFVFFGATGDLAYKQIFPALQAMLKRGVFDMPVIGVSHGEGGLPALLERARKSLEENGGGVDEAAFEKLTRNLRYVNGDYGDPKTFADLRSALGDAKHPLHYLAIPPSLFGEVARSLADAGCAKGARIIVEKPFGRDLESARELNRTLLKYFCEDSIYRIDHYLGKEPVQNLTYFRVANPRVEATFSRKHVESVQITMAEKFGVAGRGKFYEETGAIRDVVQNHMLQVIACLGLELPKTSDHEDWRNERTKLLQAVKTLRPSDVVRGQFKGYRDEPGVDPKSKVETYAALRFRIKNHRWKGVPFYVRVGKCLPTTVTEVFVRFKPASHAILDEKLSPAETYRFQLTPDVVIAFGSNIKKPGTRMEGCSIELEAHRSSADEMHPYERLFADAAAGDPTLFARQDAVEEAWRIVDPILGEEVPVVEYAQGSWGPSLEKTGLIPKDGGWHDPK